MNHRPVDETKALEDTTRENLLKPPNKAPESEESSPLNMSDYSSMFCAFLDEVLAEVKKWEAGTK